MKGATLIQSRGWLVKLLIRLRVHLYYTSCTTFFGANKFNKNNKCQCIMLKERKGNYFVKKKKKSIQNFMCLFLTFPNIILTTFCGCFLWQNPGVKGRLAVQSYWDGWGMGKISTHPPCNSKDWLNLCHLCGTENRSVHM